MLYVLYQGRGRYLEEEFVSVVELLKYARLLPNTKRCVGSGGPRKRLLRNVETKMRPLHSLMMMMMIVFDTSAEGNR